MKTKSVVTPRKIQRTVLNLKRLALGVRRLKDAIIHLSVRRDEVRHDGGLGDMLHVS
ncbi:MAG: hypothetical protein WBW31_01565 [Candidatus Sulfotelmatobacter sp.]